MFSRFKSLITEIKSDINDKIDHFEADAKKVRNKISGSIDQNLSLNGIDYLVRKEAVFEDIDKTAKLNEKKSEEAVETIKITCNELLRLKTNADNFKNEYSNLLHLISLTKKTIDRVESLCNELNSELDILEDEYDEKMQKLKLKEMQTEYDNYCAMKIKEYEIREREKEKRANATKKVQISDDPLENFLANEDDGITLGKLSLNPQLQ